MHRKDWTLFKIKDFVAELEKNIHRICLQPEVFGKNGKYLARIDSELTKAQIRTLIAKHKSDDSPINVDTLQPFLSLIRSRWKFRIIDTNAITNYNHRTHGNLIIDELAPMLSQPTKIHPHKILMSTLELEECDDNVQLHKVVMSSDNKTYIDVAKCLAKAHEDKTDVLYHTHPVNGQRTMLTADERLRVINHDAKSRSYFEKCKTDSIEKIDKAFNNLRKNIGYVDIGKNYGEKGDERLKQRLIPNFERFVQIVMQCEPSVWDDLVVDMPFEVLDELLRKGRNIHEVLNDSNMYNKDELHNRAVFFLIQAWNEKRVWESKNEIDSFLGWITGLACTKTSKKPAVKISKDYVKYDYATSFNDYVNKPENIQHKDAINDGLLLIINKKMQDILHAQTNELQSSWIPSFSFRPFG